MILVRTSLQPSSVHGFGVFASEKIPAGTLVWKFHPAVDLVIAHATMVGLPVATQEFIHSHAYLDSETRVYILCGDLAKFCNHASVPNTTVVDDPDSPYRGDIAARDIEVGEELTTNYAEFDAEWAIKLEAAKTA